MKTRGLLIACVLLTALVGALYWSNRARQKKEESAVTESPNRPRLFSVRDADIVKIDLRRKDGEEIAFERKPGSDWQITAPRSLSADQSACSVIASTLSLASAVRIVEDKMSDPATFGLAEPAYIAAVTAKDNKTTTLRVGDDTPTGNAAFAAVEGDPRVYTIASYVKSNLDKHLDDFRDKRLVTLPYDKVQKLTLVTPQQDMEFVRSGDQWQSTRPRPARIDTARVDEVVRATLDARMDLSVDSKTADAAFASGTRVATSRLTGDSGSQQLEVRKKGADVYARSSAAEGAYKVQATLGPALDKKFDDFRNKSLFDFSTSEPDKLEIHAGGKTDFYTRSGGYWWSADGKKMDVASVQGLVDALRGLTATRLLDSGAVDSQITLVVTSNDGKRVEKVFMGKSGGQVRARRDGDPTVYELDASALDSVQKALAGVTLAADGQPAPGAKPAGSTQ